MSSEGGGVLGSLWLPMLEIPIPKDHSCSAALRLMAPSAAAQFKQALAARRAVVKQSSRKPVDLDNVIQAIEVYLGFAMGFLESSPPSPVLAALDNLFEWVNALGEVELRAKLAFVHDTVMMLVMRGLVLRAKALELIGQDALDAAAGSQTAAANQVPVLTPPSSMIQGQHWMTPKPSAGPSWDDHHLQHSSPKTRGIGRPRATIQEQDNSDDDSDPPDHHNDRSSKKDSTSRSRMGSLVSSVLSRVLGSNSTTTSSSSSPVRGEETETAGLTATSNLNLATALYDYSLDTLQKYARRAPEMMNVAMPRASCLLAAGAGSVLQAIELLRSDGERNVMEGVMPETTTIVLAGYVHMFVAESLLVLVELGLGPARANGFLASVFGEVATRFKRASSAFAACSRDVCPPTVVAVFCSSSYVMCSMLAFRYQALQLEEHGNKEGAAFCTVMSHAYCGRLRRTCLDCRHVLAATNHELFRTHCAIDKAHFAEFRVQYTPEQLVEIASRPDPIVIAESSICAPVTNLPQQVTEFHF